MIDIKELWEAMPRDVQRKISCHDLKRIVDNYNGPCSADQMIQALREQIQHDIKMCAEAIDEIKRERDEAREIAENIHRWMTESLKSHGQGFLPDKLPWK